MIVSSVNRYTNFFRKGKLPPPSSRITKGQCKISEEELVERVIKLAHKDAAAGKDSQNSESIRRSGSITRYSSAEWRKLRDDYISFASPDREGIIRKKLSQMSGKVNSASLMMGAGRKVASAISFGSSQKVRRHDPDVGSNYVIFRDGHGKEVARYAETCGWTYSLTADEDIRRRAFYDLWKQALADAKEELEQEQLEKKRLNKELLAQEAQDEIIFEAWA